VASPISPFSGFDSPLVLVIQGGDRGGGEEGGREGGREGVLRRP